jgi:hypothetical protein
MVPLHTWLRDVHQAWLAWGLCQSGALHQWRWVACTYHKDTPSCPPPRCTSETHDLFRTINCWNCNILIHHTKLCPSLNISGTGLRQPPTLSIHALRIKMIMNIRTQPILCTWLELSQLAWEEVIMSVCGWKLIQIIYANLWCWEVGKRTRNCTTLWNMKVQYCVHRRLPLDPESFDSCPLPHTLLV